MFRENKNTFYLLVNICLNCSNSFSITDTDRAFYQKIDVSEPTLCPDCRQQRRLAWRNERQMYRRRCDATGKEIISMYPSDSPFKVYEQDVWWSDTWNALEYGREFDFSRLFFEQFRELQLEVPRLALVNKQSENAHYTNHAAKNKNCYLSGCVFNSEDLYYSDWVMGCRDLVDCSYMLEGSELCYEVYYAWNSYECAFCDFIKQCQNLWFCYDCVGSSDCFLCSNLRNKKYCIRNKQYTKEEYEKEMKKILPFSYSTLQKYRKEYIKMKDTQAIRPAMYYMQVENSSGDLLFSTKNCHASYDSINGEDSRYCYDAIDVKDVMDVYHIGWAELMYECHAISNGYNCRFCHFTYDCSHATYSDGAQNCKNIFGCVGLHNEEYCILNKKYSKKEYEELMPRIIEHMRKISPTPSLQKRGTSPLEKGGLRGISEYGEFFPIQFAPFAYNQSRAQEYYPLTKKEAEDQGIPWSDYTAPLLEASKIIPAQKLPEYTADIPDDVLDWGIECEVTGKPFKLVQRELEFYRKTGLPIPRRHPDQRYSDRMDQRNPRKILESHCTKCNKEIETSFSPQQKAKVYCEACYLNAVY